MLAACTVNVPNGPQLKQESPQKQINHPPRSVFYLFCFRLAENLLTQPGRNIYNQKSISHRASFSIIRSCHLLDCLKLQTWFVSIKLVVLTKNFEFPLANLAKINSGKVLCWRLDFIVGKTGKLLKLITFVLSRLVTVPANYLTKIGPTGSHAHECHCWANHSTTIVARDGTPDIDDYKAECTTSWNVRGAYQPFYIMFWCK